MTITNKTNIVITILGQNVLPGRTRNYNTIYNNGLVISSQKGSCEVSFVDGKLKCKSNGKLTAKAGMSRDRKGLRTVNIILMD